MQPNICMTSRVNGELLPLRSVSFVDFLQANNQPLAFFLHVCQTHTVPAHKHLSSVGPDTDVGTTRQAQTVIRLL